MVKTEDRNIRSKQTIKFKRQSSLVIIRKKKDIIIETELMKVLQYTHLYILIMSADSTNLLKTVGSR